MSKFSDPRRHAETLSETVEALARRQSDKRAEFKKLIAKIESTAVFARPPNHWDDRQMEIDNWGKVVAALEKAREAAEAVIALTCGEVETRTRYDEAAAAADRQEAAQRSAAGRDEEEAAAAGREADERARAQGRAAVEAAERDRQGALTPAERDAEARLAALGGRL